MRANRIETARGWHLRALVRTMRPPPAWSLPHEIDRPARRRPFRGRVRRRCGHERAESGTSAASAAGTEKEDRLAQASLCIDAMSSVVLGLGDRMGAHAEPLHAALSQMQLAFTQVKNGDNAQG